MQEGESEETGINVDDLHRSPSVNEGKGVSGVYVHVHKISETKHCYVLLYIYKLVYHEFVILHAIAAISLLLSLS